ncbi:MAG: hypothetical protein COA67_10685 [Lutibacter sp.]|nr:MAG: hypothetical protein COA67_10685 [Lutibacter sp.]
MKFIQRFAYYGVGLLVGSIFVYFVWGKKGASFDYMPNARVLKDIRTDTRLFSDNATESMQNIGIDTADISAILKYGNVDFKKSDQRGKPCKTFVIDGLPKEKDITIVVKKCDETSTIDKVTLN